MKKIIALLCCIMLFACSKKDNAYKISIDFQGEDNIKYGFHGSNRDGVIRPAFTSMDSAALWQINPDTLVLIINNQETALVFDEYRKEKMMDGFEINGQKIPGFSIYRRWYQPLNQETIEHLQNVEKASLRIQKENRDCTFDFDDFGLQKLKELSVGHDLPRSSAFLFEEFTNFLSVNIAATCLNLTMRGAPAELGDISVELYDESTGETRKGLFRGKLNSVIQAPGIGAIVTRSDFVLNLVFDNEKWIIAHYDGSSDEEFIMSSGRRYDQKSSLDESIVFKVCMKAVNGDMGPFPALEKLLKD